MLIETLIHSFVEKSILFLFLFVINIVFSIRIGHISNTIYIASSVDQLYLNTTCDQCTCLALNASAVGWNCMINNDTCQLIQNYSIDDFPSKLVPTITFSGNTISTPATTFLMERTTATTAMTSTPTLPMPANLSCSTSGRGNLAKLHSNVPFPWIQRFYDYTATSTTATIVFGVNGPEEQCLFLDDISVVDIANPFIELLNNPGFENSPTVLLGWDVLCSSTCGNDSAGRLVYGIDCRSSGHCYRGQCDSHGVDFLIQTFPTILNHNYIISFWYHQVELHAGGTSLYLYLDII